MRHGKQLLTPTLAAGAGILMMAGALAAQEPAKAAAQQPACSATIAPQALKVQKDAFQLRAALTQSIGDVSAVSVQEEGSGVQVALAPADQASGQAAASATEPASKPAAAPASDAAAHAAAKSNANPVAAQPAAPAAANADEHAPQVVWLSLNSSVAKPGDYTVQLQGANGTCTGKVSITGADAGSN